jgi:hypothetical protein
MERIKIMSKEILYLHGYRKKIWRYKINGKIVLDHKELDLNSIGELERYIAKYRIRRIL